MWIFMYQIAYYLFAKIFVIDFTYNFDAIKHLKKKTTGNKKRHQNSIIIK